MGSLNLVLFDVARSARGLMKHRMSCSRCRGKDSYIDRERQKNEGVKGKGKGVDWGRVLATQARTSFPSRRVAFDSNENAKRMTRRGAWIKSLDRRNEGEQVCLNKTGGGEMQSKEGTELWKGVSNKLRERHIIDWGGRQKGTKT